ncbi:MAG: hypothetical protein ACE5DM_04540 [Candidatus Nanoarchaeia archaeon]
MKRMIIIIIFLLMLQIVAVSALTSTDAKKDWIDAKKVSQEKRDAHQEAKLVWAGDKTPENDQAVVGTGKEVLHAALDEAEAWLIWKRTEAEKNPFDVDQDIVDQILNDVDSNLGKIDGLREDVDGVTNRLELGLVFLKMVGKYGELLTDVARDSGNVWVWVGNEKADKIDEYEQKLRDAADGNDDVLAKLDDARDELDSARANIDKAESVYKQVVIPGTPLIKFQEGNQYLRAARANLINAHRHLDMAYRELAR